MKLGIIIGIENYINYPNKNLAASKNDVLLLEKVVGKSKEFDDLLAIKDGSITAKELKNELETYFNKYQGQEIEELFFYFSGHGLYLENEFYYICSDYDENKKRTTTLENSELDTYIKSIQPKLTVKVVDACNSGVNYVKDINSSLKELENTIDKSIGNFGKCYFMFSSESNQKSYADNNISFFTKSFLKCIIENINSKIRYKDIVDYISDEFELNNKQTPYFITQGNHTEVFIQANNDIVKGINLVEFETSSEESVADDSIVKIVIEDAKKYCSQKEVSEIFTKIVTTIDQLTFTKEINEMFEIEKFIGEDLEIPSRVDIASWLVKQNNTFAKVIYKTVKYREKVLKSNNPYDIYSNRLSTIANGLRSFGKKYSDDDYEFVDSYREKIDDFKITTNLPFSEIRIDLLPKFPNLSKYSIYLVPIVSKTTLYIFHGILRYKVENWDDYIPLKDNFKWNVTNIELKKMLPDKWITDIITEKIEEINKEITQKFLPKDIKNSK